MTMWVEVKDGEDMRAVRDEVESRIEQIRTFPSETERPRVYVPDSNSWREVITVAVAGDLEEEELSKVAERVRDDLVELKGISQAEIKGKRPYEIRHRGQPGEVALLRRQLPRSQRRDPQLVDRSARRSIQSSSGNLNIRAKGQAYTREQFAQIPIRAADGADVRLGEVATSKMASRRSARSCASTAAPR